MMWSKKTDIVGKRVTETCFAWWPVQLDQPEDCVVWLETYKRDIVYSYIGGWPGSYYDWLIARVYK